MAKPRIFISSTFYDLTQIREDLDTFISTLGFEVIRNEKGSIPFGKDKSLDSYCYDEINKIDILVGIIGGRFGSSASSTHNSITQKEIITALQLNKQVYLFIQENVKTEFETYQLNKKKKSFKYRFVDNVKIYEFIEYIYSLAQNNTVFGFKMANDINILLREQFAGLFKVLIDKEEDLNAKNYYGSKFIVFKNRINMIKYFEEMYDMAEKGDTIWAQGISHTAYPDNLLVRLRKLSSKGVNIKVIINGDSPLYVEFEQILKQIPTAQIVIGHGNNIRIQGLSEKEVLISLPSVEKYEAFVIKDPNIAKVFKEWYDNKFQLLIQN